MAKIKRIISVLSAVTLCVSLASCSDEMTTNATTEQTAVQTYSDEAVTVIQTVYFFILLYCIICDFLI